VAPPGNQAETENTNINLQHWEQLIYSTFPTECVCGPEKPEAGCGAYTLTIQREELEN